MLGAGRRVAFVFLYQTIEIPDPNEDFQTQTSFVYYSDGKTELGRFATQNRESIPLAEMPQNIQDAVVAAENRTFWTDKGIDPKGILRAAFSNARGNATQGASTITQQYVKILYLTQERTLTRKAKEAILSLKLQRQQTKKEILEGYLNTIYFGRGAYGIQAASKAYFDEPAKDLNLKQSAVLASVLNNPDRLRPGQRQDRQGEPARALLLRPAGMVATGAIDAAEAEQAEQRLPKFPKIKAESTYGGQKGHMLKLVKDELHRLGFKDEEIDGGGPAGHHHLHPQGHGRRRGGRARGRGRRASRTSSCTSRRPRVEPGHRRAARVLRRPGLPRVADQLGGLRRHGRLDVQAVHPRRRAQQRLLPQGHLRRQLALRVPRRRTVGNEGSGPDGLGNDYGAAVNATYATEQSINTAYIDMSSQHPATVRTRSSRPPNQLGIPPADRDPDFPGIPESSGEDLEADSRITLGKARLSPINMANAYATIAAEGQRSDVHVIEKVTNSAGETLYNFKQPERPGRLPGRRGRHVVRPAAGGQERHRPGRARPVAVPRRRQDRHRHQRQGPGVLGVVRGLHPAAVDRGDVRPR